MENESSRSASKCTRLKNPVSKRDYLECIDNAAEQMTPSETTLVQWAHNYARNHRYRLAEDLRMLQSNAYKEAAILECGSCPPFLTLALHELDYNVTGVDLAPERFADAISRQNLHVLKVDFESESLPFADETFDVVLFNEVFEHLRFNLIATMTEVCRVMKPGATLFLSTPNLRSLRGFWSLIWHRRGCHIATNIFDEYDQLRRYGHMGHVREYTAPEVSKFLFAIGFTTRRTAFRTFGPAIRRRWHIICGSLLERGLCRIVPSLSPLFSLICEKTP